MTISSDIPVRPFSEELARSYFKDVVLGLEYCEY